MPDRHVLVLAAGQGTRMKSSRPKVLHRLAGSSLIEHVLRAAAPLDARSTTLVVGHQANILEHSLQPSGINRLRFVRQEPQLGTAHALLQAEPFFTGVTGALVVLSGDAPLIGARTLKRLVATHEASGAAATVLTAVLDRPSGYGRILRHGGQFTRIIEESDASPEQQQVREVNSGIYAFDLAPLFATLHEVPEAGPKNERYLPTVFSLYRRKQLPVETVAAADPNEIRGINSQSELAEVSSIVRQSKNEELMATGVTLEDPATTYIDRDVEVGPDTVIHPGVMLEGRTRIGARCELHAGVRVVNSTVGADVTIRNFCVITDSHISDGAQVGPFAHLRPESSVGKRGRVGNFVELKKATLGEGAKANHLSYVGDATIGPGVNIGAGTITCNYDGAAKHHTTLEANVFIGSGTQLVAPVTVGKGAYVAAGSCITDDVPAGALGITRGRQENKTGWVARKTKPKGTSG